MCLLTPLCCSICTVDKMDSVLCFLMGQAGDCSCLWLRVFPLDTGVLQYHIPWCTEKHGQENAFLPIGYFMLCLLWYLPHQVALQTQLHSTCLCQTWGRGKGSNPSSQPHICNTTGSWVLVPGKLLSDFANLLPFALGLSTLWHIGQTSAAPTKQQFTEAPTVGPDFVFPLFTARLQQGQRYSYLHRKQQDVVYLLRWSKALWGGLLANSTEITQL